MSVKSAKIKEQYYSASVISAGLMATLVLQLANKLRKQSSTLQSTKVRCSVSSACASWD